MFLFVPDFLVKTKSSSVHDCRFEDFTFLFLGDFMVVIEMGFCCVSSGLSRYPIRYH